VVCENGDVPVKTGVVTKEDIERLIDASENFYVDAKYTIITSTPVYYLLDDNNHYIDVIGNRASVLRGRIAFVLARKQYIDNVTSVMERLGVRISAFVPETLAESLFLVPCEERDISAVLLNIGYYDTNVTVVYGDAIVYNKTIHAGGMHVANDLSLVLNMDVDMAEQIKKRHSFGLENTGSKLYDYAKNQMGRMEKFDHALVSEVIDARVEHICNLISGVLEQSPLPIVRRTRIYLSGGGLALMKGAQDILERNLKRQVRIPHVDAPQLSTPNYFVALALLDYVFESHCFGEGNGDKSLISRLSDKMYD
jgi:cell division protein FtsA